MKSVDIEREVIQLRALVNDLASRVNRRRASFSAPAVSSSSEVLTSVGGYTAVTPLLLAQGDESYIADTLEWRTLDLRLVVPLSVKQVRLQFQARVTDQTQDNLAQFSVRPNSYGPEQIALWVSAGSGDDTAATGFADISVSDMRTVDYGLIGFRTFDPSSNDLGEPTQMDARVGWAIYLIGYTT